VNSSPLPDGTTLGTWSREGRRTASVVRIALLRDLAGWRNSLFAVAVGVVGLLVNLAVAVLGGLLVWWLVNSRGRTRSTPDLTLP